MNGGFWVCPRCASRNKGGAFTCVRCSQARPGDAPAVERRPPYTDRLHLTRATRVVLAVALVAGVGLAVLLVRTFRGPALDAAGADSTARPPVTMHSAPPAPSSDPAAPSDPPLPRRFTPRPPVTTASRDPGVFTDADLRAYAAQRGGSAVQDAAYRRALRQRRVDDLRARLTAARSDEERAALQGWLESALRDLDDERDRP